MTFISDILPLRRQAEVRDGWLKTRLETLLPELMEREDLDMWLIACREYNEDPVIMSLLPATSMSARRRTILLFARDDAGAVERLTVSRYGIEGFFEPCGIPTRRSSTLAWRASCTSAIPSESASTFRDVRLRRRHLAYGASADRRSVGRALRVALDQR